MTTYLIGDVQVTVGSSYVISRWQDGLEVHAHPQGTEEQAAIAKALGYGDDTDALCRQHDLLHHLISHARGWPHSRTLRGVAEGQYVDRATSQDEEALVMLVARLLNVGLDGVLADYQQVHDAVA